MWSDIQGWFDFADIYDEAVDTAKHGDTLVEVGCALGRSVAYLARRAIDSGKNLRIVAVDVWWNDPRMAPGQVPSDLDVMGFHGRHHAVWEKYGSTFRVFLGMMRDHAPEELDAISVVRMPSLTAAKMFSDDECHMVFIDANHEYDGITSDLMAWDRKVHPGGIFAGHDCAQHCPGVQRAVEERFGSVGYQVQGTSWRR